MQKDKYIKFMDNVIEGKDITEQVDFSNSSLIMTYIHKVESIRFLLLKQQLADPKFCMEGALGKCIDILGDHLGYADLFDKMSLCVLLRNVLAHDSVRLNELINDTEFMEEYVGMIDSILDELTERVRKVNNRHNKNNMPRTSHTFTDNQNKQK